MSLLWDARHTLVKYIDGHNKMVIVVAVAVADTGAIGDETNGDYLIIIIM